MASYNRSIVMGNLCRDPELRYTAGGKAVATLTLAVNTNGKTNQETLFIDVVVWERQAENCCEYLTKGSCVHVEGRLKMDQWDDKDTGAKRSKISIIASNVTFLRTEERGAPGSAQAVEELDETPAAHSLPAESQQNLTGDDSMDDLDVPF